MQYPSLSLFFSLWSFYCLPVPPPNLAFNHSHFLSHDFPAFFMYMIWLSSTEYYHLLLLVCTSIFTDLCSLRWCFNEKKHCFYFVWHWERERERNRETQRELPVLVNKEILIFSRNSGSRNFLWKSSILENCILLFYEVPH